MRPTRRGRRSRFTSPRSRKILRKNFNLLWKWELRVELRPSRASLALEFQFDRFSRFVSRLFPPPLPHYSGGRLCQNRMSAFYIHLRNRPIDVDLDLEAHNSLQRHVSCQAWISGCDLSDYAAFDGGVRLRLGRRENGERKTKHRNGQHRASQRSHREGVLRAQSKVILKSSPVSQKITEVMRRRSGRVFCACPKTPDAPTGGLFRGRFFVEAKCRCRKARPPCNRR
jgi:hypothetical protein